MSNRDIAAHGLEVDALTPTRVPGDGGSQGGRRASSVYLYQCVLI